MVEMNKDELFQAEYRTRMTRSMSDEDLAREMYEAGYEARAAEVKAVMDRLAEAEYVISGMHHLGTSTAAVNAATALNQYLEKYGFKKPFPEPYTEGE